MSEMPLSGTAAGRIGAADDVVLPFQLETHSQGVAPTLRGRAVRLGGLVDDVLSRHAYPAPVAGLLAEGLALTAALAGALKYEGVFTLQAQGDGPVPLMVADVTSEGALRGYAKVDEERLAAAADGSPRALLGSGFLAFTVDRGDHTERYQGIVELKGETLAECAQFYFRQSEQIDTAIQLAAGRSDGGWRATALMLQRLPEDGGRAVLASDDTEDPWRRAMLLMATMTSAELLDPALSGGTLLYRLFHEDGVRVFRPRSLNRGCRCSRERIVSVLRRLPDDEIAELKADGRVEVTCEFCSSIYAFEENELETLFHV